MTCNYPKMGAGMNLKIFVATIVGTMLEYFDFLLFLHFSMIISPLFFPTSDPIAAAIMSLGVLAVGFIARPIGGLIFGTIGDQRGRKRTLSLAVFGIGLPTLCIGLMPTYAQIGVLAPVALLLCRVFQGFSLGGEYTIAGIFLMEHINGQKRGFYSSLLCASGTVGSLIALGCSYLVLRPGMPDWAWRVPFLLGAVAAIFGYKLRQVLKESPEFIKIMKGIGINPEPSAKAQWQEILSNYKAFLITIGIGSLVGVLVWTPMTYTNFYLTKIAGWPLIEAMPMTLISVVGYIVFLPLMGMVGDAIGHRKLMFWSASVTMVAAYPLFLCLTNNIVVPFQIAFAFLAASFGSTIHAMMIDLYPPAQRCRAISLGFSIGIGTLGGASPFIAAALVNITGSPLAPAIYIMLVALFGVWAMSVYHAYDEKTAANIHLKAA